MVMAPKTTFTADFWWEVIVFFLVIVALCFARGKDDITDGLKLSIA